MAPSGPGAWRRWQFLWVDSLPRRQRLGHRLPTRALGQLTTLVALDAFSGAAQSVLVLGADGNFYATGAFGGASGLGTVFSVTPSGSVSVLVSFDGTGGFTGWFSDALVRGADGNFYCLTQLGGPAFTGIFANDGYGTAFVMAPDGTLTTLAAF